MKRAILLNTVFSRRSLYLAIQYTPLNEASEQLQYGLLISVKRYKQKIA